MTTKVAEKSEIERLRRREVELLERDRAFARALYELGDAPLLSGEPEFAEKRQALQRQISENNAAINQVRQRIAEERQGRKRSRLAELLGSDDYKEGVLAGLRSLEPLLAPWLELVALSRRYSGAESPPFPPRGIAALVLETRGYVLTLGRLGVIKASDVPPGLRALMEASG